MADVIGLLERIGQDAQLRHAGRAEIESMLTSSGLDPALRDALVGNDTGSLRTLLGANTDMCCLIHAPDDDDEEGEMPDDGDDDFDDDDDE
jgi:hypothetical protein